MSDILLNAAALHNCPVDVTANLQLTCIVLWYERLRLQTRTGNKQHLGTVVAHHHMICIEAQPAGNAVAD